MREEITGPGARRDHLAATLKAVAALHALLVLAQALLAGNFMAGDASAMRLHQVVGTSVLYPVAIGQLILAGVLWRRKQLAFAYPVLSLLVVIAEGAQIGLGFTGRVASHVPLGVALFGATVAMLLMSHAPHRHDRAEPPQADFEDDEVSET